MYDFFLNRLKITFRPKYEDMPEGKLPEFELTLSKKMNYETLAQKVGEHLNYEATKLRFWSPGTNGQPKGQAIRRNSNSTLAELVQPSYNATPSSLFYYELLDISLQELETKKTVKITWMGLHNKEEVCSHDV